MVELILDCDKGTLSFILNGKSLGELIGGLEGMTLYPALFLYDSGHSLTMLDAQLCEAELPVVHEVAVGDTVTLSGGVIYQKGSLAVVPRQLASGNKVSLYRLCSDVTDMSVAAMFEELKDPEAAAAAPAEAVIEDTGEDEVHQGIWCDGCRTHPIRGPRYTKRLQHDTHDMCKECWSKMPADERKDLLRHKVPKELQRQPSGGGLAALRAAAAARELTQIATESGLVAAAISMEPATVVFFSAAVSPSAA